MKLNNGLRLSLLFPTVLTIFCSSAQASSIFIGHSTSERLVSVDDRLLPAGEVDLSPSGLETYLSLDLNDNWSITANYYEQEDYQSFQLLTVSYDIDSLGLSLGFHADNWSVYYQYTGHQQEEVYSVNVSNVDRLTIDYSGTSHSLAGSYFFTLSDDWELSLSTGLHYNKWEQEFQLLLNNSNALPMTAMETGDSTLVSVSGNFTYYRPLNDNTGFSFGTYIGWNEVLSSDSESEIPSSGNNNRNNNRNNAINNFVITGSESYGIASVYLSFDFYENWILDIDTNTDFGAGDSSQSWSISLGYIF